MIYKFLLESITEYEKAHNVARINASKPIEQGGLGLPENNTAMDRAKAMGYTTKAYHGTSHDFNKFDNSHIGKNFGDKAGHFFTPSTTHIILKNNSSEDELSAGMYAKNSAYNSNKPPHIIPVLLKMDNPYTIEGDSDGVGVLSLVERGGYTAGDYFHDHVISKGHDSMVVRDTNYETDLDNGYDKAINAYINRNKHDEIYAVKNPHQIRSIHAAFDPMQKENPDILS